MCKFVKLLYGLKQTPKQWHQKFDATILSFGFKLNQAYKCVYSKFDNEGNGVIICLYVDDMVIFGISLVQIQETKDFLFKSFQMKNLIEADWILGIKIISQFHYIEKVLHRFGILDTNPVSSPMEQGMKFARHTGRPI